MLSGSEVTPRHASTQWSCIRSTAIPPASRAASSTQALDAVDVRRRLLLATPLLLAACNWDEQNGGASPARYRSAVNDVLAHFHAPGAVAGFWVPGAVPWTSAFGIADVTTGRPMTLDDHFSIRSITKSFTVTAIFQLARDGALSLDDTISQYVPGIPNGATITLTQLAAMESGVRNYTEVLAFLEIFAKDFAKPWTNAEIVSYAIPKSPVFDPGAQYNYSNTNTILLGMVVESVTQAPLGDFLQARIFDPLGLADTTYPTIVPLPDPHPLPYLVSEKTGEQNPVDLVNPTALGGAGAMVSTLDDLAAWAEALGTGRLLTPAQQTFRLSHSRPATDGPVYDRYGVGIGQLDGRWGHTGSALGFQAAAFYDPRTGAFIATAVNASPLDDTPRFPDDERRLEPNIAEEIFRALAAIVASP